MDLQAYILLPGEEYHGKDLLIGKQRILREVSWRQAHVLLQQDHAFMLPPRVFFHFLHYLHGERVYDGKGDRISDEERRGLVRQYTDEWLDAHFTESQGTLYFESSHLLIEGMLTPQIKRRYDSLETDRISHQGINLMQLILHPTETGLPTRDIQRGQDYFLSPRIDAVMRWVAEDEKKGIACRKHPDYTDSSVGVREARFREDSEQVSLEIIDEE